MLTVLAVAGYRSLRAAQFLKQRGFTDVASVDGGTDAWVAAGNPFAGDGAAKGSRIVETEWAHAGASRNST